MANIIAVTVLVAAAAFAAGYEKQFGGDPAKPIRLVFKDAGGRVRRTVELAERVYSRDGRRFRSESDVLEARGGAAVVVLRWDRALGGKDRFEVVPSSGTEVSWYAASGELRCRLVAPGRLRPAGLSDDGETLALVRTALDPLELEGARDLPRVLSKEGPGEELSASLLQVFAKDCSLAFEERGPAAAFHQVALSPDGRWLAFSTGRRGGALDGPSREMKLVELPTGRLETFAFGLKLDGVDETGSVYCWEFEGHGTTTREVQDARGKTFTVPLSRYRKVVRALGEQAPSRTGDTIEAASRPSKEAAR